MSIDSETQDPIQEATFMLAKSPVLSRSRGRTLSKPARATEVYSSQASEILALAGDSPDQIAETLRARGVQGVRNAVRMLNPIVRLIQQSIPPTVLMNLMDPQSLRMTLPDGTREETPVPQPVVDFLTAFHEGKYPALEFAPERD
jgi:hypothetical protein